MADQESSTTGLTLVNATDLRTPNFFEVTDTSEKLLVNRYEYGNPTWSGKDECFVCRVLIKFGEECLSCK